MSICLTYVSYSGKITKVDIPNSAIEHTEAIYGYTGSIRPRNICHYHTAEICCPKGNKCGYYHIDIDYLYSECSDIVSDILNSPKYLIITKNDTEVLRVMPEAIEETELVPTKDIINSLPILKVPITRVCRMFVNRGRCNNGNECQLLHVDVSASKVDKAIILDNIPTFAFVPVNRNNRNERRIINKNAEVNKLYFSYNGNITVSLVPPPPRRRIN